VHSTTIVDLSVPAQLHAAFTLVEEVPVDVQGAKRASAPALTVLPTFDRASRTPLRTVTVPLIGAISGMAKEH
jgi:hypothetical protein